ncbi:MBL fold metallo-hydrolase [Filomicrobium sp.]|uniref:MBL fold metallo-hydrolase n=1 Tax=Filomicrobium sp. TaxID=2024831 RepID=UPI00259001DC|nr:MBL fold metallo-hydrolase [Filomicrobium sp.]
MKRGSLHVTRRALSLGMASAALCTLGWEQTGAFAAAPMLGVKRPKIYRFKLGAFEITNILDGVLQRSGPHPIFGHDQPVQVVQEFARANQLPDTTLENPYIVTLVNTGNDLVLFDTGNGGARGSDVGMLAELLPQAGYKPEQVDIVVITHGHPDHIGGLMSAGRPTFPNARYVFGQVEFDYWKAGKDVPEARQKNRELFLKVAVPIADKATFIAPGQNVVSSVTAVDAFGHSPGMLAYNIESEGRRLLLWADVTNHYVMSLMKPEWHVSFDHSKEDAVATRRRILDMVATDAIPAIGYHMPFPAVGFVEKTTEGYRWVPASYQFNL